MDHPGLPARNLLQTVSTTLRSAAVAQQWTPGAARIRHTACEVYVRTAAGNTAGNCTGLLTGMSGTCLPGTDLCR